MLHYNHFTLEERKYLQKLLSEGKSIRQVAYALGRNPSSVSREIARNRSKHRKGKKISDNRYNYHHWRAHALTISRRRQKKRYRLQPDTPEFNYILEKLKLYWPPETIVMRWRKDHPNAQCFGVSTIYRAIKRGALPGIKRHTHLRRRGKRYYGKRNTCITIHPDRIIPQWPEPIKLRQRIGDWEGDTVYGGIGKGLIVTLVDRKTRYLCAALIPNRGATVTRKALVEALKGKAVESVSLDNGSEFAEFHEMEKDLSTLVYFAEPHKPWQRGTNENTNDIIRFFYPKGTNFHSVTPEELQEVVDLINNRPRKCLNYLSPKELFES